MGPKKVSALGWLYSGGVDAGVGSTDKALTVCGAVLSLPPPVRLLPAQSLQKCTVMSFLLLIVVFDWSEPWFSGSSTLQPRWEFKQAQTPKSWRT